MYIIHGIHGIQCIFYMVVWRCTQSMVYGLVSTGRGLFLRESVAGHWFPLPSHSHLGSIIILDNLGPWLGLGWTLALFHFQDLMKNLWVGLEGGQGRASLGFNLFPVIAAAGAAAQCRSLHTIDCRWRKTIQIQIQNTEYKIWTWALVPLCLFGTIGGPITLVCCLRADIIFCCTMSML